MPEPDTTPDLRARIAAAIRDAACTGDCGQAETECRDRRIQPVVWHHGVLAAVEATPEQIADVVAAVRDQEMVALRAQVQWQIDAKIGVAGEWGNAVADLTAERARADTAERRAQAVARTAREEKRRRRDAEDILQDLIDPDPCRYDHHGYCQAHSWMATEPACPHARAKALLTPPVPGDHDGEGQ